MIKDLIKLANELDAKGLTKEADTLDSIIGMVKESLDASGLGGFNRHIPRRTKSKSKGSRSMLDWMQLALDAIGLVPGFGEPFDAANAAIHTIRGNPLMALLSAISVIPIYGDAIGKGTKLLLWGIRTGKAMKFGANTYTVASLGKTLKGQLDKVNDGEVKGLLDEIDRQTGKPKGTMYSMYNEKVKKTTVPDEEEQRLYNSCKKLCKIKDDI